MSDPRIPENEIVPRGEEIYESEIRPRLGAEDEGKLVILDVESGDFEVSDDDEEASGRIEERRPEGVFRDARGVGGCVSACVPHGRERSFLRGCTLFVNVSPGGGLWSRKKVFLADKLSFRLQP